MCGQVIIVKRVSVLRYQTSNNTHFKVMSSVEEIDLAVY